MSDTVKAPARPKINIYLAIDDIHEMRIARKWVDLRLKPTLKPGEPVILLQTLQLLKLTPEHVVVPLVRGDDRSSMQVTHLDAFNSKVLTEERALDTLVDEVRVGSPIAVSDHWTATADAGGYGFAGFGGELATSAFLTAVARTTSPCLARCENGSPTILHLTFV